jgi:UDP-N-acetylmuramate dehydrogenase
MDSRIEKLKKIVRGDVIFEASMKNYTSWKIGGQAAAIVTPADVADLTDLVDYLRVAKVDYRPLGDGTNLLVREGGYKGVFIRLGSAFDEIAIEGEEGNEVSVKVGGALRTSRLVRFAAEHVLTGVEMMAGIPGRIGGAIYGNAGTPQKAIGDRVDYLELIDRKPKLVRRSASACGFKYRGSKLSYKEIIVAAHLKLKKGRQAKISAEIDRVKSRKKETQPSDWPTCGSVFKNPKGKSAGQLIDKAGLKGVRVRGAAISEKHANFIVNIGDATANDVIALIGVIREQIKKDFEISLETEVVIIGQD